MNRRTRTGLGPMMLALLAAVVATTTTGAQDFAAGESAIPRSEVGKVLPFGSLLIVYFEEPGLARYMGDIEDLEATNPVARGERKLDATSPASRAYLDYLDRRHEEYILAMEQKLGRAVEPVFRYRAAVSGMAVQMSRAEGKLVESIPGILRVIPDSVAPLDTDRGPVFIGADGIWNGTTTGGLPGTHGEGIVAGILDSGINMDHPSFAEVGGDAYVHVNPNGTGVFVGWCDPTNPNYSPTYPCNDKLIGGWDYTDAYCAANPGVCSETDGPEDDNGHGSHTASTTAGNVLLSPAISGVAPHANIIAYDVCYTSSTGQGLCPFTSTSAAADQALLDGVDVTNYSIGGGSNPWAGDIDTFFLELVGTGAVTAASAGNGGPNTVAHLGPWVTTSGASTHDRANVENSLINMAGGVSPPGDMTGASRTNGYGPDTVVYAGDYSNGDPNPQQCLNPFPAGTWTAGQIVLCDRGTIARVLKCAHVAAGGAAGCILANASSGDSDPVADPHVIPAIHVNLANGNTLRSWLATGAGHTGTITPSAVVIDPAVGDIMASFSSTGPNEAFSTVKPDVTNPGVSIFAAVNSGGALPPPEFGTFSGTSMSSPHTAGSAALIKALYPAWSPSEVKSALMMTAKTTVKKPNGVDPAGISDFGAGRIDLTKAALVGMTLDDTYGNYVAANPAFGGLPHTLNLPSLQQNACVSSCTWNRTFDSTATVAEGDPSVSWTVSFTTPVGVSGGATPSAFSLGAGQSQQVEFTIDAPSAAVGAWVYAQANLTPDDGSPVLHLPIAIKIAENNFPSQFGILTTATMGQDPIEGLQYHEAIADLTIASFGFQEGELHTPELNQDPTNGNPYDNLSQVFYTLVDVPPGALRLAARTSSSEAPDVDLFVGTGSTPSSGTQQCASTTATATESCVIDNPSAGTWWVLAQNWAGSASQPDLIEVVHGVVPSSGNSSLIAVGPASVAAGDPFDIDVNWNLTTTEGAQPLSRFWFGALRISDGANPPIGTIYVNLELEPDAIFWDGFESGDLGAWSSTQP